jgi:hypothetical protein
LTCVPEPKQKDVVDIAIDFFFGALAADLAVTLFFSRDSQIFYNAHWRGNAVWICLLAATLIFGSLAALFRNQFWSNYETYSNLPPMEEAVSPQAKVILWMLFAMGCASLGLLFIV